MSDFVAFDIKLNKVVRNQNFQIHNVRNAKAVGTDETLNTLSQALPVAGVLDLSHLNTVTMLVVTSNKPLYIEGIISGMAEKTIFPDQATFVLTCPITNVVITNNSDATARLNVTYIDISDLPEYLVPMSLITFGAFERIAPLGFTVTTLANVRVQNLGLDFLTNDQATAPSTSAVDLFRICDIDGTPSPVGAYVMYLDDNITQANASGTLQLSVGEVV